MLGKKLRYLNFYEMIRRLSNSNTHVYIWTSLGNDARDAAELSDRFRRRFVRATPVSLSIPYTNCAYLGVYLPNLFPRDFSSCLILRMTCLDVFWDNCKNIGNTSMLLGFILPPFISSYSSRTQLRFCSSHELQYFVRVGIFTTTRAQFLRRNVVEYM